MMKVILRIAIALVLLLLVAATLVAWQFGVLMPSLDKTQPNLPEQLQRPAVLVVSKANGYVHKGALPAGKDMLDRIGKDRGWTVYHSNNAAVHNAEQLSRFDVVVWNNTSGTILTKPQQQALRRWLESGGAWVGLHAAGGDFVYQWAWYVDHLLGAQFIGHTSDPQFQDAVVEKVVDNSMTAHLPARWPLKQEEWYAFDRNPRDTGAEILLAMDESSYKPNSATMEGEHPIAWRQSIGKGRMVYSAIGHQAHTYDEAEFESLISEAIRWSGRLP